MLVLQLPVLRHFPLIQTELTPLIEEQINHRTVTNSSMFFTLRWVGSRVSIQEVKSPQSDLTPWKLTLVGRAELSFIKLISYGGL